MQTEKLSRPLAVVPVKVRGLPLIRHRVIQPPIPVDVGGGYPSTDLLLIVSDLRRQVVIAAAIGPDEKRDMRSPAEVVARLKMVPELRKAQQFVVAHRDLMQIRPAIDFPLHKAR